MENKKLTVAEWLKSKLPSLFENDENGFYKKLFDEAIDINKNQLIVAYAQGYHDFETYTLGVRNPDETEEEKIKYVNGCMDEGKDYYEQVYGK